VSATDDRELERFLQRGDALSRAYAELKSERPSPALDQAVLARARDALKSERRPPVMRPHRWHVITALAATILLSFGLVMRLALEPESQLPAPAADRDSAAGGSATTSTTPFEAASESSPIEARREDIESEIRAASEIAPAIVEPELPDAVPRSRERAKSASPPAPMQAEPPARVESDNAQGIVAPASQSELQRRTYNYSPTPTAARDMKSNAPPSAVAMPSEVAVTADAAAQSDESLAKEESTKAPEVWLEEIRRLRAAGELEAADRELERFKRVYPGYLEMLQPQTSGPEPR